MPAALSSPRTPKTPQQRQPTALHRTAVIRSTLSASKTGTKKSNGTPGSESEETPSKPKAEHQNASAYVTKKAVKSYGDDCIKIVVGKDETQRTFSLHASHITARSRFFEDATAGSCVHLPEDDPDIFAIYVHLLYTGLLAILDEPASGNNTSRVSLQTVAALYVLADKLEDVQAKNAFLEALFEETDKAGTGGNSHFPGSGVATTIYNGTMSGSPARKLLVDLYTLNDECYIPKTFEKEDWPVEFLHDLEDSLRELGEGWIPSAEFQSPKRNMTKYLEGEEEMRQ